MAESEYLTLVILVTVLPGNGNGPSQSITISSPQGVIIKETQEPSDITAVFIFYQKMGWKLLSLILVEEKDGESMYEAQFRRRLD